MFKAVKQFFLNCRHETGSLVNLRYNCKRRQQFTSNFSSRNTKQQLQIKKAPGLSQQRIIHDVRVWSIYTQREFKLH